VPSEPFTTEDLVELSAMAGGAWLDAADRDWSAPAGTLEWTCLATADHAVDCVYAPAFFLASRRTDDYPVAGGDLCLGDAATPPALVESLEIATRLLVALVRDTVPSERAVLFRRPVVLGAPPDFVPRAALELALHAHDVGVGLDVPFVPPDDIARRLREHTREWPFWMSVGDGLAATEHPWEDLLIGSGRRPPG
jgi:hypothetical protein